MGIFDNITGVIGRYLYWMAPTSVGATDIIEILILAFLFYEFLAWIKYTRAWVLFKGILIILIFVMVAAVLQMNTILWLASKLVNVGIIAIFIVFQPELRNALEHLGRRRMFSRLFSFETLDTSMRKEAERVSEEVVSAVADMGRTLTGALIVFEKDVPLDEYVRTGIEIDSIISRQLLRNIFEHNTPLHDGAVIVRSDRIVAATCYLPLSDNTEINKAYGTRHRAAVGISEVSDSLTVIVSEETGKISIARDGDLRTNLSSDELKKILIDFETDGGKPQSSFEKFKRRFKHDEADHE